MIGDEEVSLVNDGLRLAGTYHRVEGGAANASMLLVAGSGEHDRNQNGKRLQLNLFNDLARMLADVGVSTLRCDKRGCGASEGDYMEAGHVELVSDALAWYDLLHDRLAEADRPLFVLGHSEGSIIAPQIAAQRDSVAGQVLLMPFLEAFEDTVLRQMTQSISEVETLGGVQRLVAKTVLALSGDPAAAQRKLLERSRNTTRTTLRRGFRKVNVKWLRELDALDPEAVHTRVSVPTLAIAGGKDLQCRPDDAEQLARLSPDTVTAVVLPDLTHILRVDEEPPAFSHYPRLCGEPIDPRIVEHIARWLRDRGALPETDPARIPAEAPAATRAPVERVNAVRTALEPRGNP